MSTTLNKVARDLAVDAGVSITVARFLVQHTFASLSRYLEQGRGAKIRGLGTFKWVEVREMSTSGATVSRTPAGKKLKFIPAYRLRKRRALMTDNDQDQGMTKYAVVTDPEKTKEAEVGHRPTHCPVCLEKLDSAGACPTHGTEPFEPTTAP